MQMYKIYGKEYSYSTKSKITYNKLSQLKLQFYIDISLCYSYSCITVQTSLTLQLVKAKLVLTTFVLSNA